MSARARLITRALGRDLCADRQHIVCSVCRTVGGVHRGLVAVVSACLVAACLSGCGGPACDSFQVGFTTSPQGEATPRDAVARWLMAPNSGARDLDPSSWQATGDALKFVNGDQTVTVADFTHVPGGAGFLVEGCR